MTNVYSSTIRRADGVIVRVSLRATRTADPICADLAELAGTAVVRADHVVAATRRRIEDTERQREEPPF